MPEMLERLQRLKAANPIWTWKAIALAAGVPFKWLQKRIEKGFYPEFRYSRKFSWGKGHLSNLERVNERNMEALEQWLSVIEERLGFEPQPIPMITCIRCDSVYPSTEKEHWRHCKG